ncbi:MAG: hypothetical protein ACW964_20690 [Candidatus Hodarchaeales archaeon]|jgi:hypothetical protein
MLEVRELIDNLPLSAQKVYHTIKICERLNSRELIAETQYSRRTVHYYKSPICVIHDASIILSRVEANLSQKV